MQVNASLLELIEASNKKITPCDWTNLPMENPGKYYTLIPSLVSHLFGCH